MNIQNPLGMLAFIIVVLIARAIVWAYRVVRWPDRQIRRLVRGS